MRYIGKDIVTRGSALVLDVEEAWRLLRSRARQGIRKAERAGVEVVESRDLGLLAAVWYDADTLPARLGPEQRLFAAYLGGELLGAIIITPVSPNTLFYHYGGSNELGRSVEANAYLLWHVVKVYDRHPVYRFLDVGVSFRHELQHYFQKHCTHSYPILFNPPPEGVMPRINVNPFDAGCFWQASTRHGAVEDEGTDGGTPAIDLALRRHFGRPFTWTPNGRQALRAAVTALGLGPEDVVTIFPSLKTRYVSGCVTEAIEDVCGWSLEVEPRTRAILVIHEWGVPHPETEALCAMGLPVIEDCAYSLTSTIRGRPIGSFGQFAVFSLPKVFPVQYGGLLVGAEFTDREVWDRFHCLDVAKRELVRQGMTDHWHDLEEIAARRRENWEYLDSCFRMLGFRPVFEIGRHTTPGVYMLRLNERHPTAAVRERMSRFGIECGIYHGNNAVFLPCHHRLGPPQLDYIFGAFRGMVNPCHTYVPSARPKTVEAVASVSIDVARPAARPAPAPSPVPAPAPVAVPVPVPLPAAPVPLLAGADVSRLAEEIQRIAVAAGA